MHRNGGGVFDPLPVVRITGRCNGKAIPGLPKRRGGYVSGGVLYECVRRQVPFVLAGSIRDDGPLPDVFSDVVKAADAMRDLLDGVHVAVMLASTLHDRQTSCGRKFLRSHSRQPTLAGSVSPRHETQATADESVPVVDVVPTSTHSLPSGHVPTGAAAPQAHARKRMSGPGVSSLRPYAERPRRFTLIPDRTIGIPLPLSDIDFMPDERMSQSHP
jgi:hypothetical protein